MAFVLNGLCHAQIRDVIFVSVLIAQEFEWAGERIRKLEFRGSGITLFKEFGLPLYQAARFDADLLS